MRCFTLATAMASAGTRLLGRYSSRGPAIGGTCGGVTRTLDLPEGSGPAITSLLQRGQSTVWLGSIDCLDGSTTVLQVSARRAAGGGNDTVYMTGTRVRKVTDGNYRRMSLGRYST